MNPLVQFDFTVDKANNAIHINRAFEAPLPLVWEAWTNPAIKDLWWAPKPYTNTTVLHDFKPGGRWMYFMSSPEGEKHYCVADFDKIVESEMFSYLDGFSDENGVIESSMPRSHWTTSFIEHQGKCNVVIAIQYESLDNLEMVVEMGFKEGFGMAMENLDQYFEAKR